MRRRVVLMCAWEMQGCFEGRSVASLGLKEGNGEKGERLRVFLDVGERKKKGKRERRVLKGRRRKVRRMLWI